MAWDLKKNNVAHVSPSYLGSLHLEAFENTHTTLQKTPFGGDGRRSVHSLRSKVDGRLVPVHLEHRRGDEQAGERRGVRIRGH